MNNVMPSSPVSFASQKPSQTASPVSESFIPPDDIINDTLVSLFYLTSEGGFISKDARNVDYREKDGKIQIRIVIGDSAFWMDAREISMRLSREQRRRITSDRAYYFISENNGKFRCNHRMKSAASMRLEQYQEMSGRYAQ